MNKDADAKAVGVRLGQACISNDISVAAAARQLRVSRQTIYNWFCGASTPQATIQDAIEDYIATLN